MYFGEGGDLMDQFTLCHRDMLVVVSDFHGLVSSASQQPAFLKHQGLVVGVSVV